MKVVLVVPFFNHLFLLKSLLPEWVFGFSLGLYKSAPDAPIYHYSQEVFYKKVVIKNFIIFAGKQLRWNFFWTKLQHFKLVTLLKRYFNTVFFTVNIAKHLPTAASVDCKNFWRATERQTEMEYKSKSKFIVYFEQILQRVLVFLLLTLNR